METKDDFIICPNTETDNAQMARLIRCVIDEFGVSRTSMVYDDPATDCIFAYLFSLQAVINCEKIISQLGKNIFPVGAIWFCSWDLVFRQLLHEYTARICVVSLRQVSESQNVRLCLLKTSCFPSPVRPHTRSPRSRVYNIMRVGQESLLFLAQTVK